MISIQFQDAASIIASLRGLSVGDKRVQNEIDSIRSEDKKFKSIPEVSFVGICEYLQFYSMPPNKIFRELRSNISSFNDEKFLEKDL